jgi:hypothetical protein
MSSAISFINIRNNKGTNTDPGFIPGYSTTHQLVELYHNILLALDNKEMTSITFADVSKAFDRVWIRGLILN